MPSELTEREKNVVARAALWSMVTWFVLFRLGMLAPSLLRFRLVRGWFERRLGSVERRLSGAMASLPEDIRSRMPSSGAERM